MSELNIMTAYVQVKAKTEDAAKKIDEIKEKVEGIESPQLKAEIDTKDFTEKVKEAEETSSSFGSAAGDIFKGIASQLTAAGVTALINGFITGVNELMSLARNAGNEITASAEKLGVSTKAYQIWNRVLKLSGGSADDLSSGLSNINKLLDSAKTGETAKGFEETADAFKELGINAKDADGNLRSTDAILEETISALAKIPDGDKKLHLEEAIFGKNSNLHKMLEQSASDIEYLKNESSGKILSDKAIESSVKYADALDRLNTSLDDLKSTVAMQLLEPLTSVLDTMTKIIDFFNPQSWNDKSAEKKFEAIDAEAEETALGIASTAAQAESFIDKLMALNEKTDKTAKDHAAWKYYAGWLIEHIPSLGEAIDIEGEKINGEAKALKENVQQWKKRQQLLIAEEAMASKRQVVADLLIKASEKDLAAWQAEGEAAGQQGALIEKLNKLISESNDQDTINAFLGGKSLSELSRADLSSLVMLLGSGGQDITGLYEMINQLAAQEEAAAKARADAEAAYKEYEEESANLEKFANSVQDVANKAGEEAASAAEDVAAFGAEVDALPESKTVTIVEKIVQEGAFYSGDGGGGGNYMKPYASGSRDIPYDQPAYLHRGEMVLTASQARRQRDKDGGGISVQDLTQAFVAAMHSVKFAMDKEVVGGFVAPTVGEQLAAAL